MDDRERKVLHRSAREGKVLHRSLDVGLILLATRREGPAEGSVRYRGSSAEAYSKSRAHGILVWASQGEDG